MKPKRSKTSDPDKLAFWRKQCQDWQGSGLSQRAFCQREGLVYSSFDYWRRRAAPVV
ncbi:IS66 family insertion sequence element accessory protein TnpA, partial [Undibacterium sp. Di27W]|uniref:IS66 family insertion sequence element accessory protein TnpA n=1 Tax=Undibacterium sp. Di27W TaxID=3413036 RepID=UPI003BF199D9